MFIFFRPLFFLGPFFFTVFTLLLWLEGTVVDRSLFSRIPRSGKSCSTSDVRILRNLRTMHGHPTVCVNSVDMGKLRRLMCRVISGSVSRTLTNCYSRVRIAVGRSGSVAMRSGKHNVPMSFRRGRRGSTLRMTVAMLRTKKGFSGNSCGISNNLRNMNVSYMGTLSARVVDRICHGNGVCRRRCRVKGPLCPMGRMNRSRRAKAERRF